MYQIIDGKSVSNQIKQEIADEVADIKKREVRSRILWLFWLVQTAPVKLMSHTKKKLVKGWALSQQLYE